MPNPQHPLGPKTGEKSDFRHIFYCRPAGKDYSVFGREEAGDECDAAVATATSSDDEADRRLLMFSDGSELARGAALWRQQFSSVAWLHMLNLWRERKALLYV